MKRFSKVISIAVICAMLGTGIPMPAYAVQSPDEINLTVEESESQSSGQSEQGEEVTSDESSADTSVSEGNTEVSSETTGEDPAENSNKEETVTETPAESGSEITEAETESNPEEATNGDETADAPKESETPAESGDETSPALTEDENSAEDQAQTAPESEEPQNAENEEPQTDESQAAESSDEVTPDEATPGEETPSEATTDEEALESEELLPEDADLKVVTEDELEKEETETLSSAEKPDDVSLRPTVMNAGASSINSMSGTDHALLIQSAEPWNTSSNTDILETLKQSDKIDDYFVTSVADSTGIDFSNFKVILFANDQSTKSYVEYEAIKTALEGYAYNGGVVLFGACDNGWADGLMSDSILNGVTKVESFEHYNYVADATNPIVTGIYSEKTALTADMLEGNWCSHVTFDESTLPQGAKVILRGKDSGAPTLVEYPYGQGNVILSGLTWEYAYEYTQSGYNMEFGRTSFDDYILHGLALSNIDPTKAVLNPITIDLTSKKLEANDDWKLRYKITAEVINNNGDDSITDVFAKLTLPDGSGIENGSNPQMSSIVKGGQSTTFEWDIWINDYTYSAGGGFIYSVNAGSNKTVALSQEGIIHLAATDGQSNELDFDKDVWEFPNFSDHAHCNILNKAALYQGLSPSEKAEMKAVVKEYEDNGTGGHCYGMAASSILFKMGIENTNSLYGVNNLRSVKKSDGGSLIDYYHATQHLKAPSAAAQSYMNKSTADQLKELEEKASKVNSGGSPVLVSYGTGAWSHAVVGYACEPGEFKSSKTKRKYNRRILIYDSNSTNFWGNKSAWSEDYCLLFNEGTDEWEVPAYCTGKDNYDEPTSRNQYAYLKRAISDLDIIDCANRKVGANNYSAEVRCYNKTKFQIWENGVKKWLTEEVLKLPQIIAYLDDVEAGDESSKLHIVLPDESATYGFETQSGQAEKVDLQIMYNGSCYVMNCDMAKSVSVDPKGKVELKGNEAQYTIVLANDNPSGNNFETYTITGNCKGDISAEITEEGIKISGDNIKGSKVAAETGDKTAEIEISSEKEIKLKKGSDNSIENASRVTGIKLNKSSVSIGKKGKYKLVATVTPADAANQKVIWKSSNSKIASVSADGVVKAKKIGKCKITATTEDGGFKAVCKVKVTKTVNVKSVSLNKKSVKLKKGDTVKLKAKIKPKNATIKDVKWKSSNTKVATVNSKGKVTAKKKGTCYITVKTKNGKKTAKCKITVK